jgi:uncharacterized protein (DUF1697 family)
MAAHIALLRAVNLGGKTMVAMAKLRAMAEKLGFVDVRTLQQSGNLVFETRGKQSTDALEKKLEAEAEKEFGRPVDVFVRDAKAWAQVIAKNPFPAEAKRDPGHLVLLALKDAPNAAAVKALEAAIKGRESVRAVGRHAYVVYPDGIGRSKLTNAVIEKALTTRATGRNWNTVLKLAEMVKGP